MTLSTATLDEGAALLAAATPGPWTLNKRDRKPMIGFDVKDGGELLPIVPEVHGYDKKQAKANAALILWARNNLESIIAAARQAQDNAKDAEPDELIEAFVIRKRNAEDAERYRLALVRIRRHAAAYEGTMFDNAHKPVRDIIDAAIAAATPGKAC